ncbi:phage tail tape measure protein, partial [Candidatus Marinimicrobia bacterium]|nr:phage tail tape measure protein [Candidatus Neomarinimicrobiota bacterium]
MADDTILIQMRLQAPSQAELTAATRQIQRALSNVSANIQIKNGPQAVQALKQIKTGTDAAKGSMTTFGEAIGLSARRFVAFTSAVAVVGRLTSALSRATREAVKFEREFVKLAQVFDTDVRSLGALQNSLSDLSREFGLSATVIAKTSVVLAQSGLTAKQTEQAMSTLAKTTLAATFDSIASSTEGAVAIMAQFGTEATKLESQLGAINAVSKKFAVESGDIIEAVRRSGGAFRAAGGTLNEFIALFTSVRSTTRESAETIATGFRTIFARLQRPKTIEFFRELNIELTDGRGNFIGAFEAIKRLSEGLKRAGIAAGSIQFAGIVEQLGGIRQVSRVIPLLQQFTKAEEARQVAIAGGNSLDKDAAKAQATLAQSFARTTENFSALIREISQTASFKAIVTVLLDLANAFIEVARSLKPLIPLIATFAAFKLGRLGIGAVKAGIGGAGGAGGLGKGFNKGGKVLGFNRGGTVPGTGNGDTVPAMLEPGEFVIRKSAVQAFGADQLAGINKYANPKKGTKGVEKEKPKIIRANIGQIFPSGTPSGPEKTTVRHRGILFEGKPSNHVLKEDGFTDLADELAPAASTAMQKIIRERLGSKFKGRSKIEESQGFKNAVKGFGFESYIDFIKEQASDRSGDPPFDFKRGQTAGLEKLTDPEVSKGLYLDATTNNERSKKEVVKKGANQFFSKTIARVNPKRKASGGSISGTDTVPALLTPGEFVINKKSAESFGYSSLDNINKYAKGGVVGVQKFANGGEVGGGTLDLLGGFAAQLAIFSIAIQSVAGPLKRFQEGLKSSDGAIKKEIAARAQELRARTEVSEILKKKMAQIVIQKVRLKNESSTAADANVQANVKTQEVRSGDAVFKAIQSGEETSLKQPSVPTSPAALQAGRALADRYKELEGASGPVITNLKSIKESLDHFGASADTIVQEQLKYLNSVSRADAALEQSEQAVIDLSIESSLLADSQARAKEQFRKLHESIPTKVFGALKKGIVNAADKLDKIAFIKIPGPGALVAGAGRGLRSAGRTIGAATRVVGKKIRSGIGKAGQQVTENPLAVVAAVGAGLRTVLGGVSDTFQKVADDAIASGNAEEAATNAKLAAEAQAINNFTSASVGAGAAIGSAFGPVGTIIGSLIGGVIGLLSQFKFFQTAIDGVIGVINLLPGVDIPTFAKSIEDAGKKASKAATFTKINKSLDKLGADFNSLGRDIDPKKNFGAFAAEANKLSIATKEQTDAAAKAASAEEDKVKKAEIFKNAQEEQVKIFEQLKEGGIAQGKSFAEVAASAPALFEAFKKSIDASNPGELESILAAEAKAHNAAVASQIALNAAKVRELKLMASRLVLEERLQQSISKITQAGAGLKEFGQRIRGQQTFDVRSSAVARGPRDPGFNNAILQGGQILGQNNLANDVIGIQGALQAVPQAIQNSANIIDTEKDPVKKKARLESQFDAVFAGIKVKDPDLAEQFEGIKKQFKEFSETASPKKALEGFKKAIDEMKTAAEKAGEQLNIGNKVFEEALGTYSSLLDERNKKESTYLNNLSAYTERFFSRADKITNLRGGTVTRTDIQQRTARSVASLGFAGQNGVQLANQQGNANRLAANMGGGATDEDQVQQQKDLQNSSMKAGLALKEYNKGLEQQAGIIEQQIEKEKALTQARRDFSEQFVFGTNEQRQDQLGNLANAQQAARQGNLAGASEDQRSGILSILKQFENAAVFDGQTGAQVQGEIMANELLRAGLINQQEATELRKGGSSKEDGLINGLAAIYGEQNAIELKVLDHQQIAFNTFETGVTSFAEGVREFREGLVASGQASVPATSNPVVRATGGMIYADEGTLVNYQPKGTDTVPAMLTPGEFVVRKSSVDKYGSGMMEQINAGNFADGGVVTPVYRDGGGSSDKLNYAPIGSEQELAAREKQKAKKKRQAEQAKIKAIKLEKQRQTDLQIYNKALGRPGANLSEFLINNLGEDRGRKIIDVYRERGVRTGRIGLGQLGPFKENEAQSILKGTENLPHPKLALDGHFPTHPKLSVLKPEERLFFLWAKSFGIKNAATARHPDNIKIFQSARDELKDGFLAGANFADIATPSKFNTGGSVGGAPG